MQGEEILRYVLNDRYCGFEFIKKLCETLWPLW